MIWGIDGWFVIVAIIMIVVLTAFYLSLALVAELGRKDRILVQQPTGTKKRTSKSFFDELFLEDTGLISNVRRETPLGFFPRMRRKTELFLERLFYG